MYLKHLLRKTGFDMRRYHSLYDTLLRHHSITTVLDIGANDGEWSAEMRRLLPQAQVYAFEPLADHHEGLISRFKNDRHFQSFNVALGEKDGEAEIERSSFHPSSSLLPMAALHKELYPKSKETHKEKILIRRLDSIAQELTLTPNILVKMDVQGFEDKVIAGGKETLGKATIVIAETSFVELYKNQPLFGDIHDALRNIGFSYHGNCGEHYSPKTGERIYEDSVFVKN